MCVPPPLAKTLLQCLELVTVGRFIPAIGGPITLTAAINPLSLQQTGRYIAPISPGRHEMGISTKPVQRWEALKVPGITIKPGGSGIVVEMTVDGAARLVEHVQRWKVGKGDSRLFELFPGRAGSTG